MKKITMMILGLTFISGVSMAEEFKEITPIEDQINIEIHNEKPTPKQVIEMKIKNDRIKAEQDFEKIKKLTKAQEAKKEKEIKKVEKIEKKIVKKAINLNENPIREVSEVMKNAKRDSSVLDLEQKQARGGKIYAIGQDKPYTGAFGLYLGDFIEYKEDYVNGALNGDKTWYSDNGNIVLKEHYKNNKIYGDQKAYYENGNIKSIVKYKNGQVVGIIDYDKNGKIIHEDHFKKGTGVFKYFWENGNVSEVGRYKNWHKDGKWKRYNKDGSLDKITTYKRGRTISEYWY